MAGERRLSLSVEPEIAALAPAQRRLRDFLVAAGVSVRILHLAELLTEEVLVNVIRHGGVGTGPVEVDVGLDGSVCRLVFEDGGVAFDPTTGPLPPLPASLEDAPIGGRGLILLRRLAREVAYRRMPGGRNRLTVMLQD